MPRMRTAKRVFEIIKAQDPDTEVTMNCIRSIINSGKVPVTVIGYKKLVDADVVIKYITDGGLVTLQATPSEERENGEMTRLRKVEV